MNKHTLKDIASFLPSDALIFEAEPEHDGYFTEIASVNAASKSALTFVSHDREDRQELVERTSAGFVICDFEVKRDQSNSDKNLIQVAHPKLLFSVIGNALFLQRPAFGIDTTAVIDPSAKIHQDVYVGPGVYIGPNCTVDEGTLIFSNVCLYKNVSIGKNVIIQAGTAIGGDGYGYNRNSEGRSVQFPHVGSVIIADDVEIGSNTSIDLGALGSTEIEKGAKIDNLVHIGHNVSIGEEVYVAAQTTIGGSSRIDAYAEVWMGVRIADGTHIGSRASIGMGSVVIKNIREGKKVFGNPGREFGDV